MINILIFHKQFLSANGKYFYSLSCVCFVFGREVALWCIHRLRRFVKEYRKRLRIECAGTGRILAPAIQFILALDIIFNWQGKSWTRVSVGSHPYEWNSLRCYLRGYKCNKWILSPKTSTLTLTCRQTRTTTHTSAVGWLYHSDLWA